MVKPLLPTIVLGACVVLAAGSVDVAHGQITTPRISQKAVAAQTLGLTTIELVYHRPAVNGRKVWGGLVPFDGAPWRAGANEKTTISFSHDMLVEGKRLPAGTYGLHMIPSEKDWTVIFSKNYTSWGSFFYQQNEDALRVSVTPRVGPHQEYLLYGFEPDKPFDATVYLHWEKLLVPFKVQVADGENTVLANIRNELRSLAGFTAPGYIQAAQYCLQRKINTDEAIGWTDQALVRAGGFQASQVKSDLLAAAGRTSESEQILKTALETATENDLNNYGYTLLNQNKIKEAIAIFSKNVKQNPESWNVYDSLGEGLDKSGDKKAALKNYKKALSMSPENQKARIQGVIKTLESSQ